MSAPNPGDEVRTGSLYRRIPDDTDHWVVDEDRPASYNFIQDNNDDYLSTHWSELTTPEKVFEGNPGCGLVEVPVSVFWDMGLQVTYEPTPEDPSHVAVRGLKNPKTSVLKKLRKATIRAWRPGTSTLVERATTSSP